MIYCKAEYLRSLSSYAVRGPICLGSTGRVKIPFLYESVDGLIGQSADIENGRFLFREMEVARFSCHECKRPPINLLKILAAG